MHLFNPKILVQAFDKFLFPAGKQKEKILNIITGWQKSLKDSDLGKTKEKSVQGLFLVKFFEEILGYQSQVSNNQDWHLIQHPKSEVDAQEADGSLGIFTPDKKITQAVIELKDARSSLDKKQQGREKGYTPIEQAYLYATKFDKCQWIIVSNFREIRLYHKNHTQEYFEKFEVLELDQEKEFNRFYFLLCKQNLLSEGEPSVLEKLISKTDEQQEDISKKFYADYKKARLNLFEHLTANNPTLEKAILLEKSQKIIDRITFILFCEDTANLLPRNILKETYQLGIKSRERSDQRVWREFKNFFIDINEGRKDIDPQINGYNGGLFKADEILDNLTIKDEVWEEIVKLAEYDFESDLNVNILGHIFEQSLSDIEQMKAELAGENLDKKKSKRKKEGIFYTPEYITKFIVENTVGKFLEENPEKLKDIKILDPACGSGAFLNQAHSFLLKEYKIRHEQRILEMEKQGQRIDLFTYNPAENNRGILLNNLFGVDLNAESVEITKLALWLKTARQSEPLQNLDKNIKCGNSLIDDETVAGDKAFKWEKEFKEVMKDGGFDVVVGNPPYGAGLGVEEKEYFKKIYSDVHLRTPDTFNYFISKTLKLLKNNGFLGLIVPNNLLFQNEYLKTRQLLLEQNKIVKIINLGDEVFEDADVPTCIVIIQKNPLKEYSFDYVDLRNDNDFFKLEKYFDKHEKKDVLNVASFVFGVNKKATNLIEKVKEKSYLIDEIAEEVASGISTGGDKVFRLEKSFIQENQLETDFIFPVLIGGEINRYVKKNTNHQLIYTTKKVDIQKYPRIFEYLKPQEKLLSRKRETQRGILPWWCLHWSRYEDLFLGEKIILRQTADSIKATYDSENYFVLNSLLVLKTKKEYNFDYKFILAVLNSSITNFIYKNFTQETGRTFAEVKPKNVRKLFIPKATPDQQKSLAQKAEQMLAFNQELHNKTEKALELLTAKYKPKTLSAPLKTFYKLGWNELTAELEKQKVKLSLTDQEELQSWFGTKREELNTLADKIEKLDQSIDQEVFDLYELTEEEKKIIFR